MADSNQQISHENVDFRRKHERLSEAEVQDFGDWLDTQLELLEVRNQSFVTKRSVKNALQR